jgi:hypothetical protein
MCTRVSLDVQHMQAAINFCLTEQAPPPQRALPELPQTRANAAVNGAAGATVGAGLGGRKKRLEKEALDVGVNCSEFERSNHWVYAKPVESSDQPYKVWQAVIVGPPGTCLWRSVNARGLSMCGGHLSILLCLFDALMGVLVDS